MLSAVQKNIEETIGCQFEIIPIVNHRKFSIARAYNIGAQKAKYDMLCFVHEDVKLVTMNWGALMIAHFNELSGVGIIGVAGSIYKSGTLSSWSHPKFDDWEPKRCNLIQHSTGDSEQPELLLINPASERSARVVCLDGVFLAMKKHTWQLYNFDENNIKGFHAYDLDISLVVGQTFKNYVIYDILLEHFSVGKNDVMWLEQTLTIHLKHHNLLPSLTNSYFPPDVDFSTIDSAVEKGIIYHLRKEGIPVLKIYTAYLKLYKNYPDKKIKFIKNFLYAMKIFYFGRFKKLIGMPVFFEILNVVNY
jgi:hypothetical protein